jgi:hypothetical protein
VYYIDVKTYYFRLIYDPENDVQSVVFYDTFYDKLYIEQRNCFKITNKNNQFLYFISSLPLFYAHCYFIFISHVIPLIYSRRIPQINLS